MQRRNFLKTAGATAAAAGLGPAFWRAAYADPAVIGPGPYGPLLAADANGVMLPAGFSSRIVATAGEILPGPTGYTWHIDPDGGAVFPQPDGGWVYTSNEEETPGGAGAIRFDADGAVVDGYRILSNTRNNCAGGATPWGTWLSCEETGFGQVFECDVTGVGNGTVRPALGAFAHEAVAVDPVRRQLFLTEDAGDGRFYRFTPTAWSDDGVGTLDAGLLEAMVVAGDTEDGTAGPWDVTWLATSPTNPDRNPQTTVFRGGEGIWYDQDPDGTGYVYFTTKGDNRVWCLDTSGRTLGIIYDDDLVPADSGVNGRPVLQGVDNVTVSPGREIFVAEDGGNLELVLITLGTGPDGAPQRQVTPFLRLVGHDGSEIAGPAFHPAGDRLYVSSQRGADGGPRGMTFEITGPFVGSAPPPVVPDFDPAVGVAVAGAAAAGAWALTQRRSRTQPTTARTTTTTEASS